MPSSSAPCLLPRVIKQPKQFPQDTTLAATKDGKDIVVYMNSTFLKRIVDGPTHYPLQTYNALLSRDFRRPPAFFAWLGHGTHQVRVQNLNPECADAIIEIGSLYGRWVEPGVLEVQN